MHGKEGPAIGKNRLAYKFPVSSWLAYKFPVASFQWARMGVPSYQLPISSPAHPRKGGLWPPDGQAPPWGSWLRSRLRGEGFDWNMVSVESCAYCLANFRHSPLTASRSSPKGEPAAGSG